MPKRSPSRWAGSSSPRAEGTPKAAMLSSRALLGGRLMAGFLALLLGDRDRPLVALPWSHIMAVSTALYGMMAALPNRGDLAGLVIDILDKLTRPDDSTAEEQAR